MKAIILFFLLVPFISSSAQDTPDKIVTISGSLKSGKIKGGQTVEVQVILKIKKGWHINSDQPIDENLIATHISFNESKNYTIDQIEYPPAVIMNLDFSEDELSLFEDEAIINVKIKVAENFKKKKLQLKGEIRYQPCNDQSCLFLYSKQFKLEL